MFDNDVSLDTFFNIKVKASTIRRKHEKVLTDDKNLQEVITCYKSCKKISPG